MFAIPPDLFPHPATLSHYKEVLMGNFPAYIRNSMLVTFFSCAISLALGIPAAYGFAKYATEKTKPVFAAVTAVRMVPPVAMVIPFFLIIRNIHLSDTLLGLIITYIPFELTLIIWMLKTFFRLWILSEVEEAAELDGLSAWGILLKVVLPMSKSSVGVAGLMAFLFSWNEFMFALSLTSTKSADTYSRDCRICNILPDLLGKHVSDRDPVYHPGIYFNIYFSKGFSERFNSWSCERIKYED